MPVGRHSGAMDSRHQHVAAMTISTTKLPISITRFNRPTRIIAIFAPGGMLRNINAALTLFKN